MAAPDDRNRDAPAKLRVALTRAEPAPPTRLARSLDEAGPGRLVHIDRHGAVRSPARFRAIQYGTYGVFATLAVWMVWFYAQAFGVVGALGVGLWALAVARGLTGVWQFNRASTLLTLQRLDEAERLVDRLQSRRFLGRMLRAHTYRLRGALHARRGEHTAALVAIREAIARYRKSFYRRLAFPWLRACEYGEVVLLCESGSVQEARELLRAIEPGREGDFLRLGRWTCELHVAFAGGRLELNRDALWERAQQALKMTSSTVLLALCAWGYTQLDDRDMADHLLREAFDRQLDLPVEAMHPTLWRWMVEQRARIATAGEIDGGDEVEVARSPKGERAG